jgi:ADP-ribose pyrophosphatase YjhB (NUDIX family)
MPTRLVSGNRIGRQGCLRIGCSATVFSPERDKVLLTRRTDNNLWCLPGGAMEAGESAEETCIREVLEETGLNGRVTRLIGIYSSPDWLVEYPDGKRVQIIAICFEVEVTGGQLTINNEANEFGYFSLEELDNLDLMMHHRQRIADAFSEQCEAFIR